MRRHGFSDAMVYAGGNPCFSEVTGQTIPGCAQPGATAAIVRKVVAGSDESAVPSWVWVLAGGVLVFLVGGLET